MKSTVFNRFSIILTATGLLVGGNLFAQTVEINPAGAIPAGYALAKAWEWDTAADLEGWVANVGGLTLEGGSPTIDAAGPPANGSVKGTAASVDPTFTSPVTTVATPYRVIIEMRVKKEASDATRMDLFWDDALGGFGGPRLYSIPSTTLVPDDTFKVVRITFPYGKISGQLDQLRIDPISDAPGVGKTMALDYIRIYTESLNSFEWDADTVTTGAQGGTGTWDELSSNLWWNGSANTTWPATGSNRAVFAGTAGTVTIAAGGVNASVADFQTSGYTISGGPINLGSDMAYFKTAATMTTRIDSGMTGAAPVVFESVGVDGRFILGASNPSLTGGVTSASQYLAILKDDSLGTGTFTLGRGANTYFSALDGDRTLANNVVFGGNRMIINNGDLGTGLTVGNLTINGNLALNCTTPADLYLRRALTVNGVVSGSNTNIGLLLAGDANTLRLTGINTFTGGVKWANNSVIEVFADEALGAAANSLNFNGGSGKLKILNSFSSARAININGATTGLIDTNGFDLSISGKITGTTVDPNMTTLRKVGAGKLTLSGAGSNLFGGFRVDEGTLDITGGITSSKWSGSYGVGGGAVCTVLTGGTVNTSYFAVGNTVNPTSEAQLVVSGGSYTNGLELLVGQNGNGRFTMTSGSATLNQLSFGDGVDASRTAIIDLDGGTVSMHRTNRRAGLATATINFNGANIVARSTQTDFLRGAVTDTTYKIKAGGVIFDTSGFDITMIAPLTAGSPSGGLIKNGLGKLALNAQNTYTGDTTVNAGTLSLAGQSIENAGKLVINTGGMVEVAVDETVNSLYFGATQQPAGTYGSESSTATFKNNTYFSGTGVLTVTTGAATSGYTAWAASNAGNQPADLDFDNDGVSNGVEYFMGQSGSSFTANPGLIAGKVTWPKTPAFSGTFKVQISDTLATGGWTDIVPPHASIDTTNPNQVIFTLPAGAPKRFCRLNVTVAP